MAFRWFAIIGVFLITIPTLWGQYGIPRFGVNQFGNSFEEPFHSAFQISEDSLGRIHFFTNRENTKAYTYDGSKFEESNGSNDIPFLSKIVNRTIKDGVYLSDAFTVLFIQGNDTVKVTTDMLFNRNVVDVIRYNQKHYILNNDGVLKGGIKNNTFKIDYVLPLETERIKSMHKIGDTLFFQGHDFYYVENQQQLFRFDLPESRNNDLFILPQNRLLVNDRVIPSSSPIYDFLFSLEDDIVKYEMDSKGRLWLNLRQEERIGIFLWDGKLTKINLDIEPTTFVSDFYEDQLGDFWIGLIGQGLVQLYDQSIVVLDKNYGLPSDNIWALAMDQDQRLLFSTGCSGIVAVDKKGRFKTIDDRSCQSWIFPLSENTLWSSSVGINLYQNDQLNQNLSKDSGLYSRSAQVVFKDANDRIWIGTRRAIHLYQDNRFIAYVIPDTDVYDRVIGIRDGPQSSLILLLDNGSIYTYHNESFSKWEDQISAPNGLFEASNGGFWVTSGEQGLYLIKNDSIKAIKNPLLPSGLTYLERSESGYLWILTTDNRIAYVKESELLDEGETPEIKFLTNEDGLPLMSTNTRIQPTTIHTEDDVILFPNIHGAICIDTKKVLADKPPFTKSLIHHDTILSESNSLNLPYGQQYVSFRIQPNYTNPQTTIVHAYRLNDGDWQYTKGAGVISLTRLPIGKNTLLVKSRHNNGTWLDTEKYFIVVQPLLFQTLWFWALMMLVIGLLFYLFYQWRTKALKFQKMKLEQIVNEQTIEIKKEKDQLAVSLDKQKQLTHSLNEIQESKNRMYAQIAHEFKSPLQSVKILLDKNLASSQNETRIIKRSIDHLLSISREMMQLSKAERGQLKLVTDWYNLVGIIQDQINMMLPIAQAKGVDVVFKKDSPTYFIQVDFNLMQSVVQNLLSNAIKFSQENTTVKVSFNILESEIEVSFEDFGIGVPKNEISHLTKPYFQASNNDHKGTGIGLSLVKRILELHRSQLIINSTENRGSVFSFRLISPDEPQDIIVSKHYNHQDLDSQIQSMIDPEKPIILALDDREEILFFIKQSLTPQYYVLMAKNGLSALNILEKIQPILIISDLNMPVMGGLEFLEKIRLDQQWTSIPFIMLTGSSSEATEVKSLALGVDAILKKPIDGKKLKYHVENLINRNTELLSAARKTFIHNLVPTNIHNDDKLLMQELEDFLLDNIHNNTLKSKDIADAINMGEKTLRNRVKSITGFTIKEYLKRYRLEKAKYLLENQFGNKSEIAQAVGFSSLSYFSRCYHTYFAEK